LLWLPSFFSAKVDSSGTGSVMLLMLPTWMIYALGVVAFWGVAGVTQKRSTDFISAELSFTCFSLAFIPLAGLIVWVGHLNWHIPAKGWALGIASGALSGLGALASFAAYRSGGKASVVTPLAALYPTVTIALAVPLLHERLGLRQVVGVATALAAAMALSYEDSSNLTSTSANTRSCAEPADRV